MKEPQIVYEDKNFLAIDKPSGLMVHGVKVNEKNKEKKEQRPTLTDWLIKEYPEIKNVGDDPILRPGIVHRLDKETSGIMLIPRNQRYFEYLKALFQRHEIKKTYVALVAGKLKKDEGTIDAPIGIKNGTIKRSIHSKKMAKEVVTEYKVLKTFEISTDGQPKIYSLLEVRPKTGRTHQIRVHLASIGHPILGDHMYGPQKKANTTGRLMLHALLIEFSTEDGKRMKFEADLPEEFRHPVIHTAP